MYGQVRTVKKRQAVITKYEQILRSIASAGQANKQSKKLLSIHNF